MLLADDFVPLSGCWRSMDIGASQRRSPGAPITAIIPQFTLTTTAPAKARATFGVSHIDRNVGT